MRSFLRGSITKQSRKIYLQDGICCVIGLCIPPRSAAALCLASAALQRFCDASQFLQNLCFLMSLAPSAGLSWDRLPAETKIVHKNKKSACMWMQTQKAAFQPKPQTSYAGITRIRFKAT